MAGGFLKTALPWQGHRKSESVPRLNNGAHFHLWGFSAFYGNKGTAKFLYLQIFRLFCYFATPFQRICNQLVAKRGFSTDAAVTQGLLLLPPYWGGPGWGFPLWGGSGCPTLHSLTSDSISGVNDLPYGRYDTIAYYYSLGSTAILLLFFIG